MGQLRAWQREPGVDAHTVSWWRKLFALVLKADRLSMSNFLDVLAGLYSSRTVLILPDHSAFLGSAHLRGEGNSRGDPAGDKPASVASTVSYDDVLRFVARAAGVLAGAGIGKGDRVVVFTSNRVEGPFLAYACMRIGAVVIPVNPQYRSGEIDYIIRHSEAVAVITDLATRGTVIPLVPSLSPVRLWMDLDPGAESPFVDFRSSWQTADQAPPCILAEDDPVGIFYTSGTTGHPKGAVLSNKGFLFHVRKVGRLGTLVPRRNIHAILHALPVTHIMGFLVFLTFVCSGSPIVFLPVFEGARVIELIDRYAVTAFIGVPAMYGMILREAIRPGALQTIRVMVSAADVMPADWAERIREHATRPYFGVFRRRPIFAEFYGQVETTGVTCVKLSLPFVKYDAGCVGRRMPGVQVRIVDDVGREVRKGEIGEVAVQGDNVLKGYWGRPADPSVFTPDGWFRTGDLARRGSLGFFYFVDREKDMIKSGGYSIFSREVEEVLMGHPQVEEAAVFGVPHPIKKEVPIAAVIAKPRTEVKPDELVEWAKQRIAPYKAPRRVVVVGALPRGSTQKVLKTELRKQFAHLGQTDSEEGTGEAAT